MDKGSGTPSRDATRTIPRRPAMTTRTTCSTRAAVSRVDTARPRAMGRRFARGGPGTKTFATPSNDDASTTTATAARRLEFMVEMRCERCATSVREATEAVDGTLSVETSLGTNTVEVVTTATARAVSDAIEARGYKVRLIGQGSATRGHEDEAFGEALARALGTDVRTLRQSLACVGEFKGRAYGHGDVAGTVRFVQASEEVLLAEITLSGLRPNARVAVTVREWGDLTRGVESCGGAYGGDAGVVAVVDVDANGRADMPSTILNSQLKCWDLIGRGVAVHATEDAGDSTGAVASVLARSAGVGANHKKLCQCDGTVIWEAGEDFLPVVVEDESKADGPLISVKSQTVRRG